MNPQWLRLSATHIPPSLLAMKRHVCWVAHPVIYWRQGLCEMATLLIMIWCITCSKVLLAKRLAPNRCFSVRALLLLCHQASMKRRNKPSSPRCMMQGCAERSLSTDPLRLLLGQSFRWMRRMGRLSSTSAQAFVTLRSCRLDRL